MWILPEALRAELAKPMAPVRPTAEALVEGRKATVLGSVGDVVTEMFLDAGVRPALMCVDYRTQRAEPAFTALREKIEKEGFYRERFENPPATVSQVLWDAVRLAWVRPFPTVLEVRGEEDLATLPAILTAPEGALVAYGQPNQGVVLVPVNETTRQVARSFLDRMEKR
jgi:uncharacterized protein (UPF0218 family)